MGKPRIWGLALLFTYLLVGGAIAASVLLTSAPPATVYYDFVNNTCASYGITNARTGVYYDIGSDGNYAAVAANTCDQPAFGVGGTPALGLGAWGGYIQSIRNNSMQGASIGSTITTNGNFALNPVSASQNTVLNGWQWNNNAGAGTVVWDGASKVTITGDSLNAARLTSAALTTVNGTNYVISADIAGAQCSVWVGVTAGANGVAKFTSGISSGQHFSFTASGTTTFVTFNHAAASGCVVSNVSVGTGTQPTNWDVGGTGTVNAGSIIAVPSALATINGIDTITETISGTSAGTGVFAICFEQNTHQNATTAQAWQQQGFIQVTAGDLTNITSAGIGFNENASGGAIVQSDQTAITLSTSGNFAGARQVTNITTSGGGTVARIQPCYYLNYTGAVDVNASLTIGWPMYAVGGETRFRPPIRSTNASVTVQGDNISVGFVPSATVTSMVFQIQYLIPDASLAAAQGEVAVTVDDGSNVNRYNIGVSTSGGPKGGTGINTFQTTSKALIDGAIVAPVGVQHCLAGRADLTGVALAVDGGLPGNPTPPTTYVNGVAAAPGVSTSIAFTTINLGRLQNGNDPLDGYIQKLRIYLAPLSNSGILALSAGCGQ